MTRPTVPAGENSAASERAGSPDGEAGAEARARAAAEERSIQNEVATLRTQLVKSESELARLTGVEAELESALATLRAFESQVRDQQREYRGLLDSWSWRLTRPLRWLHGRLRK